MSNLVRFFAITAAITLFVFLFHHYRAESDAKGPLQPILFSHKIHAGDNKIPCEYCHNYVSVSPHPGIPSVQRCMGCHSQISGRDVNYNMGGITINIKKEIEKVRGFWQRKEPIPWVKVSTMPEHVKFNHKRHIKRGIECAICHGQVEQMDIVYKAKKLNMGFCISCHEQNADNDYHLTELKDCLTCHY